MPDPLLWGQAFALAALVSAALSFLARRIVPGAAGGGTSRTSGPMAVLAIAAGFAAGCGLLRLPTAWKPTSALDRFLVIVFPAAVAVETIAASSLVSRRLAWLLRIVLAGATGRLLLHDSVYLAGPHREWTASITTGVLAGSAAMLTAAWWLLTAMERRGAGIAAPLSLAMTLVGSGVAILLEGYLRGGIVPLPLAAAIVGWTLATARGSRCSAATAEVNGGEPAAGTGPLPLKSEAIDGVLGLGVVGLFSTLFIGRFFAGLSTASAVALFSAPLWSSLAESLPPRWRHGARGVGIRLLLVALPITVVILLAMPEFVNETLPLITAADDSPDRATAWDRPRSHIHLSARESGAF